MVMEIASKKSASRNDPLSHSHPNCHCEPEPECSERLAKQSATLNL
jgi:hypothetical protein